MKNVKIELANERIIPASGLAVVGAILDKSEALSILLDPLRGEAKRSL